VGLRANGTKRPAARLEHCTQANARSRALSPQRPGWCQCKPIYLAASFL